MKSAQECVRNAKRCEKKAERSGDDIDRRMLAATAVQWRKLAHETTAHERMIGPADKPSN
jgi:hypothetical protein